MRHCVWLLLCLALLGAGCTAQSGPIDTAQYPSVIRVACVGGSTTAGFGVRRAYRDSYPAQLGRLLGPKWEVRNFGYIGATVLRKGDIPYLTTATCGDALRYKPDVVIIMFGTNDSKPQNWKFADQFVGDYQALVDALRQANPQTRIYICLLAPTFHARWDIDDRVVAEKINPLIREIAKRNDAPLLDIYTMFVGQPALLPDSVHPNRQGSYMMAAEMYHALTGKAAPPYPGATASQPARTPN